MPNFLKSGQSCNYSLAVHNTESRPNPDAIRIGEIIVSKGKKFDQSMTLNIIPSEIEGPQSYDLSGSNLFCMLSPAIDPQMRSRHQREVILISGPSGSGKSTYCSQVCRAWERTIRQKIIMFSAIDNDPAFDDIKMKRIPFDKLVDENGEINDCIKN